MKPRFSIVSHPSAIFYFTNTHRIFYDPMKNGLYFLRLLFIKENYSFKGTKFISLWGVQKLTEIHARISLSK